MCDQPCCSIRCHVYERLSLGAAAKADKFIGAFMPDVEYGSGVPAIVCLVAAARLDPVGESVSIRPLGRTAAPS